LVDEIKENVIRSVCGGMEKRNACTVLMLKPEGKRPLGRHRHRRVDNVNIDHKMTVCGLD
jgi:hypothetical protein